MNGLQYYEKEERPWGNFERFTLNERTTVKIVTVKAGEAISLQTHNDRDEFWRILAGSGFITIGENRTEARPGDEFFCPRGSKHRVESSPGNLTLLEIAFGKFNENDIKRLEDRYGRQK